METIIILLLIVVLAAILCYIYIGYYQGQHKLFGGFDDALAFGGKIRRFDLFMQDPWYDLVGSGKKTLEVRIGGADKWADLVGKTIKCKNGKEKKMLVQVLARRHYNTLDEMLDKEKVDHIIPGAKNKTAAKETLMSFVNKAGETIYHKDRVEAGGGIVVFELKVAS